MSRRGGDAGVIEGKIDAGCGFCGGVLGRERLGFGGSGGMRLSVVSDCVR